MANLQPLRSHLRQNLPRLRSTPCLLISSSPPPAVSTAVAGTKSPSSLPSDETQRQSQLEQLKLAQQQTDARVGAFVERNAQSLAMEFNLRTVPCHISAAFPTAGHVDEALALATRAGLKRGSFGSGDGAVVGIGSGAAMELAKAVADRLFGDIASCSGGHADVGGGSLVLAPCTLGGLWAASSDAPPLLLDPKEEMILPQLTSAWNRPVSDAICGRRGTVVTLDPPRQLALPPLYTPFQPRRSGHPIAPSMAHVAGAALAIVLDVSRSVDEATKAGNANDAADLQWRVGEETKAVASSCTAVLELAAKEVKCNSDSKHDPDATSNQELAQTHLLDAIPRLSPLIEQSSILAQMPIVTAGTVPQKLGNALLPAYFSQCHLVTYLACILPGLCDALPSSSGKASMVEHATNAIIESSEQHGKAAESSLSSWASRVTAEAGIPSMAGLAYGTPDLNALVGSVDSYEALMASMNGDLASNSGMDDQFMEDVLQSSLNR